MSALTKPEAQKKSGPFVVVSDRYASADRTIQIGAVVLPWPFPVVSGTHSSFAQILGRRVFGKGERPIIRALYVAACRAADTRYWIRSRFGARRSIRHKVFLDLKPGWYDPDTMMLYAMMACLGLYIEESGGAEALSKWTDELREPGSEGFGPREAVDGQVDSQAGALEIWHWWTVTRPAEEARRDALCTELFSGPLRTEPVGNGALHRIVQPDRSAEWEERHTEFRALEQKIEDDTERMLRRLVDIRKSLWV